MSVESDERDPERVCNVSDCNAWRKGESVYCRHHVGLAQTDGAPEGNQNAMKTGIHSDPVNLFDWLAEHDEAALAYILGKLHDYATRAPETVFTADVEDAQSFDEVETKLTAYGHDLLFTCIRDYARWRGQKQQLQEGLVTTQTRSSEHGTYEVDEANPVNLELDRMDKTSMRQKDSLGVMPDGDDNGDFDKELGKVVRQALEQD